MDGETSIVKFEHHSRAYLEGLTKFWGFWGSSAPPYSPFCTLRTHTFDSIPLENPKCCQHALLFNPHQHSLATKIMWGCWVAKTWMLISLWLTMRTIRLSMSALVDLPAVLAWPNWPRVKQVSQWPGQSMLTGSGQRVKDLQVTCSTYLSLETITWIISRFKIIIM